MHHVWGKHEGRMCEIHSVAIYHQIGVEGPRYWPQYTTKLELKIPDIGPQIYHQTGVEGPRYWPQYTTKLELKIPDIGPPIYHQTGVEGPRY